MRANLANIEQLKNRYNYLTMNLNNDEKIAKANLLKILRNEFPNEKFKCKKTDSHMFWLTYSNDIDLKKLYSIIRLFDGNKFDVNTDCRSYEKTPFIQLYGELEVIAQQDN